MIIEFLIKNFVSPVITFVINIFPTMNLSHNFLPYITTAVGFFAELFSLISYFVPLKFFFLVILAKTGFYIVKFASSILKFVGEIL